jgi:hypothetical protein
MTNIRSVPRRFPGKEMEYNDINCRLTAGMIRALVFQKINISSFGADLFAIISPVIAAARAVIPFCTAPDSHRGMGAPFAVSRYFF